MKLKATMWKIYLKTNIKDLPGSSKLKKGFVALATLKYPIRMAISN